MEKKTGGCHCKKVRYEVDIDLSQPVIECNCSYCEMKGTLLSFVPASVLSVTSGEDALTTYRFNTGAIAHTFCSLCGVQCFGRAGEGAAINVRTIDGIVLGTLARQAFDGRSR
jgi:hypothetical protein